MTKRKLKRDISKVENEINQLREDIKNINKNIQISTYFVGDPYRTYIPINEIVDLILKHFDLEIEKHKEEYYLIKERKEKNETYN